MPTLNSFDTVEDYIRAAKGSFEHMVRAYIAGDMELYALARGNVEIFTSVGFLNDIAELAKPAIPARAIAKWEPYREPCCGTTLGRDPDDGSCKGCG